MNKAKRKKIDQSTVTGSQLPAVHCPRCGCGMDAATSPAHPDCRPRVGDLAVCAYCGQITTYDENFHLQSLPDEDFSLLPIETREELRRIIRYITRRQA